MTTTLKTDKHFRLQIISDIHFEFRSDNKFQIKPLADNLALCGDIGRPFASTYSTFIDGVSKKFKNVFLIAGNHEFYCGKKMKSIDQIKERIKEITSKYDNVHFLDNTSIDIDGVRILGTTLWTHIPKCEYYNIKESMTDYHKSYALVRRDQYNRPRGVKLTPELVPSGIS